MVRPELITDTSNNNNIPSVIPKMGSGEGRMYIDLSPTVVG